MTRRAFILPLAAGVLAGQTTTDQAVPLCPVCKTPSTQPNLPITVGDQDGVFRGAILPQALLVVCANPGCRVLFAVAGPAAAAAGGEE